MYGWHSGFVHTLHDVEVAHPGGVDPRIAVWVLRRLLELLGLIHRAGWVHGAVVPPHVLVHPRDHGAMLVGFGGAARIGNPRPPIGRRWTDWVDGPVASPATDLGQAARCARGLASGGFADPVAALVDGLAAGRFGGSAWDAAEALRQASRAAYGPAAYNPLVMPGWPASGR
ncbi:MAG: hypothetical protein ABMB14_16320 [Myxococcota bacterium]